MTEEVQRSLGSIEAKLDILIEKSTAHDKRISAVERSAYAIKAVAGVFMALLAVGASLFGGYFNR